MAESVDMHTAFAITMHDALCGHDGGNEVISPWVLSSTLGVLAPGVDPAARAEIDDALRAGTASANPVTSLINDSVDTQRAESAPAPSVRDSPLTAVLGVDSSVLEVVNTLWTDQNSIAAAAFTDALSAWPGAGVRTAPLSTAPERARQVINTRVADTTKGLISEVLPPRALTPQDRAVLVSALYLSVAWMHRFPAARTTQEIFHAPTGGRPVPTMRTEIGAGYSTLDGWHHMSLPLHRGLYAEVFVPPEDGSASAPIQLRPDVVTNLRRADRPHDVDLRLPRFDIEAPTRDIIPALQDLGVRRIFDPRQLAVTSVLHGEHLYVSGAYHAAVLRVDERGVEGAAAAAFVVRAVARRPRVQMRVDRPFWFLVTHRHTNAVLFLAKVADPS